MRKKMFLGADGLIFERAKELRENLTHAELVLWGYLKQRPLGYKFRRQHPLGIYIADFYCHSLLLVVELDGTVHQDAEVRIKDEQRQKHLEGDGLKVIRFTNHQVEKELETVIARLEEILRKGERE